MKKKDIVIGEKYFVRHSENTTSFIATVTKVYRPLGSPGALNLRKPLVRIEIVDSFDGERRTMEVPLWKIRSRA